MQRACHGRRANNQILPGKAAADFHSLVSVSPDSFFFFFSFSSFFVPLYLSSPFLCRISSASRSSSSLLLLLSHLVLYLSVFRQYRFHIRCIQNGNVIHQAYPSGNLSPVWDMRASHRDGREHTSWYAFPFFPPFLPASLLRCFYQITLSQKAFATALTLLSSSSSLFTVFRHAPKIFVCSPSFRLPEFEMFQLRTSRFEFCKKTNCYICMKAAADTIPVHKDCNAVLKKECANHDIFAINIRLWVVAAFRKPWNNSQPLFLPYPTNIDISLIETVFKEIGMPQLLDMPPEVVGMIQHYSERSLFWRSLAARSLATYISETIDQPLELQTTPLTEIMDWKRGIAVTSTSSRLLPPFITITIDSDGIRSISRQDHPSEYSIGRSISTAYIVLSQDDEMVSKLDVHNMVSFLSFYLLAPLLTFIFHMFYTCDPFCC